MALNLDSSRPLVSTAQKRELIEAVRDAAASESEPDWLEWKSTVDLSEKRWQFSLSPSWEAPAFPPTPQV